MILKLRNDSIKGIELYNFINNEIANAYEEMEMELCEFPEFAIIEILSQNIKATTFEVDTNDGELLSEGYPEFFE